MRGAVRLFRVFGIDIKIHYSWWFIFILLTWNLASAFFPTFFEGYSTGMYWLMGVIAALLLFVSVLLHELSHSLVARLKKIKVESITLFFFGGVAGITKEDMKPSSEFFMALAGPVFSLLLAAVFFSVNKFTSNDIVGAISFYLYQLNFILAVFNLVPGYPLDGGRAFRAVLYWHYKDLRKATRIAAAGGRFFAGVLIFLGIFSMFSGTGGGIWFILIGFFLYFIAGVSYEQVVLKELLDGIKVKEIMVKGKAIDSEMNVDEFIKKYGRKQERTFLIDGKLMGILDVANLGLQGKVSNFTIAVQKLIPINKNDSLYKVFQKFSKQSLDMLPVLDAGKLLGVVTRNAMMVRLQWEIKLAGEKVRSLGKR